MTIKQYQILRLRPFQYGAVEQLRLKIEQLSKTPY